MSSAESLQQAIQAAHAGRKEEARNLLLQLVEIEPSNETAWMWLAGLVDSLEDRIIACENVLTINPTNEKARAYLVQLQQRQNSILVKQNISDAVRLFNQAKAHADRNEVDTALHLARQALEKNNNYEDAWLLIGKIAPDLDQQLLALEKAYKLNPSNPETTSALKQVRYLKANPIRAAARLEQAGRFEDALEAYKEAAAKAKNSQEFDHIYKQIIRIEGLQDEKIRYVAPQSSITRLTFTWPLLYLSLILVQMGLNPFKNPSFHLLLGLPWVIIGSFLLSLAEVRSRHTLWQKIFDEHGDGSNFARLVTATAGWFLVILPYLLLVIDSLSRLHNFTIPPMPF